MLVRSVVGSTPAQGRQRKQPPTDSPHPTGVCTLGSSTKHGTQTSACVLPSGEYILGSFSISSAEHKRRPTGFPHLNLRANPQANVLLVVFLYQARNTDASLRTPLILRMFVPLIGSLYWA